MYSGVVPGAGDALIQVCSRKDDLSVLGALAWESLTRIRPFSFAACPYSRLPDSRVPSSVHAGIRRGCRGGRTSTPRRCGAPAWRRIAARGRDVPSAPIRHDGLEPPQTRSRSQAGGRAGVEALRMGKTKERRGSRVQGAVWSVTGLGLGGGMRRSLLAGGRGAPTAYSRTCCNGSGRRSSPVIVSGLGWLSLLVGGTQPPVRAECLLCRRSFGRAAVSRSRKPQTGWCAACVRCEQRRSVD